MSDSEKIKLLEAMIVLLAKKIEKLEGKTTVSGYDRYLKDLQHDAKKLIV